MRITIIPYNNRIFPKVAVTWPKDANAAVGAAFGKPFFHILTDNGIAALFLEAVAADPEDARAFVSKNYVNSIDLDALRDVLSQTGMHQVCRAWVGASFSRDPKNCRTRSVLLVDTDRNVKNLLHLHMIREPDQFGQWKIYGVEQE